MEDQNEPPVVLLSQTPRFPGEPNINLTLVRVAEDAPPGPIRVLSSELLTYDEQDGFTRLRLRGGRFLDVKESTDQIDRLIRAAASGSGFALQLQVRKTTPEISRPCDDDGLEWHF
jgi:lysylphosphatidylglycerol synthetase-like protein (DUF2156 family)